eukprot:UN03169
MFNQAPPPLVKAAPEPFAPPPLEREEDMGSPVRTPKLTPEPPPVPRPTMTNSTSGSVTGSVGTNQREELSVQSINKLIERYYPICTDIIESADCVSQEEMSKIIQRVKLEIYKPFREEALGIDHNPIYLDAIGGCIDGKICTIRKKRTTKT